MKNTKENCFKELVEIVFEIERKYLASIIKTLDFQKMALLAREDKKSTDEFKLLESKYRKPIVIDFNSDVFSISQIAEKLRILKIK